MSRRVSFIKSFLVVRLFSCCRYQNLKVSAVVGLKVPTLAFLCWFLAFLQLFILACKHLNYQNDFFTKNKFNVCSFKCGKNFCVFREVLEETKIWSNTRNSEILMSGSSEKGNISKWVVFLLFLGNFICKAMGRWAVDWLKKLKTIQIFSYSPKFIS